ncbi:hypothetical protein LG634_07120 [Streptomyces bambusae]|uniref:hypothetical protein n=1 Tax=Streptomyces bambusae TaxID=1550616 RepID=UPI001CFE9798|nr:hypothetical protein [Streptomyces bambusae]MCB5164604.1 hypothetical protein [Streptomyces bambusae]
MNLTYWACAAATTRLYETQATDWAAFETALRGALASDPAACAVMETDASVQEVWTYLTTEVEFAGTAADGIVAAIKNHACLRNVPDPYAGTDWQHLPTGPFGPKRARYRWDGTQWLPDVPSPALDGGGLDGTTPPPPGTGQERNNPKKDRTTTRKTDITSKSGEFSLPALLHTYTAALSEVTPAGIDPERNAEILFEALREAVASAKKK